MSAILQPQVDAAELTIGSLERFSAHELRAGCVTEAYKTGAG